MNPITLFLLTSLTANLSNFNIEQTANCIELVHLRTSNSKVFLLENGNLEHRFYTNPIHYWDGEKFIESETHSNSLVKISSFTKSQIAVSSLTNLEIYNSYNNIESTVNQNNLWIQKDSSKINNEYILTNNDFYIFPTESLNTDKNNKNKSYYSAEFFLNEQVEYPIQLIEETYQIQNTLNNVIEDKFFTVGMSGYTDSSVLLSGTDPLYRIDETGNMVNDEYVTVMKISLPKLNPDSIITANININKNVSTSNPLRNPDVFLYKITNNIEFTAIDGNSDLNYSFITSGLGSQKSYSFDITTDVINNLQINKDLILALEGDNSGYASFYSSEASTINTPYLSVITNPNVIGSNLYGNALDYIQIDYGFQNCLGYALNKNEWIEVEGLTNTSSTDYFDERLIYTITYEGYNIRKLDSYDSYININERRIAARYTINEITGEPFYHFVRQNSDGTWSEKAGVSSTNLFANHLTPEDQMMWSSYKYPLNNTTPELLRGDYILKENTLYYSISSN